MEEEKPACPKAGGGSMGADVPRELTILLDPPDPDALEAAWSAFVRRYSRLFLKAAATLGGSYDDRMDRYRRVLEGLREQDFHRLRSYRPEARSSFAGWLLVVSRRLAVDFERSRFGRGGRSRAVPDPDLEERRIRRRLVELTGSDIDPNQLPASAIDPEGQLRARELRRALAVVLDGLDPGDRLLLKLRFEDGLSIRDIADVMHVPTVFHVYRRLRAVLGHARGLLLTHGIDEATP